MFQLRYCNHNQVQLESQKHRGGYIPLLYLLANT